MGMLDSLLNNAVQSIAKKHKDTRWKHNILVFGSYPSHKVSNSTIKQLKSILKGKHMILPLQVGLNKANKKKVNNAFASGGVVWETGPEMVSNSDGTLSMLVAGSHGGKSMLLAKSIRKAIAAGAEVSGDVNELLNRLENGKANR